VVFGVGRLFLTELTVKYLDEGKSSPRRNQQHALQHLGTHMHLRLCHHRPDRKIEHAEERTRIIANDGDQKSAPAN